MSKEFTICLDHDKIYFPGDTIKGHIKLDLKKSSADIQNIALNFKGTMEGNGEKKNIFDQTEILAVSADCKKYTTFKVGKIYKFDFEFQVPKDKSLPSSAKIHKIANISYNLIATPKKPSFNFSHTLPVVKEEIEIFDLINVNSPDYCREVNLNTDLGFTNGSKSTQWNITAPRSAFIRGAYIQLECSMNNFPKMKKSKAIKVSFIRHVYKTSTAKISEKKVLSQKIIDLDITEITSTQSINIKLHVPSDTPPSIFPDTGRILSVSYIIQAELNMKGVKSAIKLKNLYTQEAAIVIGTFPEAMDGSSPTQDNNSSAALLRNASTLKALSPTNLANADLSSNYKNYSTISLSSVQQPQRSLSSIPKNFHGALTATEDDLKPLARLNEEQVLNSNTIRRSYLSKASTDSKSESAGSSSSDDMLMTPRRTSTPAAANIRSSYLSQSPSPPLIDRLLTPLQSTAGNAMNVRNTISYNRGSQINRGPIVLQPSSLNSSSTVVSSPHEIGPDDVINKGGGGNYFNSDKEKVISYDGEKQQQEEGTTTTTTTTAAAATQVPNLIRHDTVSTASTNGGLINEILYSLVTPSPPTLINKE